MSLAPATAAPRPLTLDDFDALVGHVTGGRKPFPWQRALADRVLNRGWASVGTITVPTGCGKTMVLAVQTFGLAAHAHLKPDDPTRLPLRLFFVVDRRVVVDDSARLARRISALVNQPAPPEDLRPLVERLRMLGGQQSLVAATLRGGLPADDTWLLEPHQPALVISTVDQVGSKLLFRAYRASDRASPIHAGLAGRSSLVVLDEAHLSRPFSQTIGACRRYGADLHVVTMTATPPSGAAAPFGLSKADKAPNGPLGPRLHASKPAKLVGIDSCCDPDLDRERVTTAIARHAADALRSGDVRVVGVMVNTVARARGVFHQVREAVGEAAHVLLVTGRIRPYDRDRLLESWLPHIRADLDRSPPPDGKPIVVVSTQTLEAGADVDFDHLVTESAPLDALRQRFGRLDRLGRRHAANLPTDGVVVRLLPPPKNKRPKGKEAAWDDPIYGEAAAKAWELLWKWGKSPRKGQADLKRVDFGLLEMTRLVEKLLADFPETFGEACAPTSEAPTLFPAHLDAWAATSVHPAADPDPAVFLHGAQAGPPDVYVVWRNWPDGFNAIHPALTTGDDPWLTAAAAELGWLPPGTGETLAVPIGAAKAWLKNAEGTVPVVTDLEGQAAGETEAGRKTSRGSRPAVLGRPGEWRLGGADDVRPGDTVVVPCGYGGADCYGWAPEAADPVQDISAECSGRYRSRPAVWLPRPDGSDDNEDASRSSIRATAAAMLGEWATGWVRDARVLHRAKPLGGGVLVLSRRRLQHGEGTEVEAEAGGLGGPDDLSFVGHQVTLDSHSRGVAELTERFARRCGLTDDEVQDLKLTALLHDLGKADDRFQLMLNGDEIAFADARLRDVLLAKSREEAEEHLARPVRPTECAWPRGLRHEYVSAQLLLANPTAWRHLASDPERVLWLTGTHHGQGRPWWPDFHDKLPPAVTVRATWVPGRPTFLLTTAARASLDLRRPLLGWTELMDRLLRRYGWWRLATYEAVLRLADHRQSQAEGGR